MTIPAPEPAQRLTPKQIVRRLRGFAHLSRESRYEGFYGAMDAINTLCECASESDTCPMCRHTKEREQLEREAADALDALQPLASGYVNLNEKFGALVQRAEQAEARIAKALAALRWLTNVACGNGKAGDLPEDGEAEAAIEAAQAVLRGEERDTP